jgi:hypothetical protein
MLFALPLPAIGLYAGFGLAALVVLGRIVLTRSTCLPLSPTPVARVEPSRRGSLDG